MRLKVIWLSITSFCNSGWSFMRSIEGLRQTPEMGYSATVSNFLLSWGPCIFPIYHQYIPKYIACVAMMLSQASPWRVEVEGRAECPLRRIVFLVETDMAGSCLFPMLPIWTFGVTTAISQPWEKDQKRHRLQLQWCWAGKPIPAAASLQTSCCVRKINPYLFKLRWAGFCVTWGQMHS